MSLITLVSIRTDMDLVVLPGVTFIFKELLDADYLCDALLIKEDDNKLRRANIIPRWDGARMGITLYNTALYLQMNDACGNTPLLEGREDDFLGHQYSLLYGHGVFKDFLLSYGRNMLEEASIFPPNNFSSLIGVVVPFSKYLRLNTNLDIWRAVGGLFDLGLDSMVLLGREKANQLKSINSKRILDEKYREAKGLRAVPVGREFPKLENFTVGSYEIKNTDLVGGYFPRDYVDIDREIVEIGWCVLGNSLLNEWKALANNYFIHVTRSELQAECFPTDFLAENNEMGMRTYIRNVGEEFKTNEEELNKLLNNRRTNMIKGINDVNKSRHQIGSFLIKVGSTYPHFGIDSVFELAQVGIDIGEEALKQYCEGIIYIAENSRSLRNGDFSCVSEYVGAIDLLYIDLLKFTNVIRIIFERLKHYFLHGTDNKQIMQSIGNKMIYDNALSKEENLQKMINYASLFGLNSDVLKMAYGYQLYAGDKGNALVEEYINRCNLSIKANAIECKKEQAMTMIMEITRNLVQGKGKFGEDTLFKSQFKNICVALSFLGIKEGDYDKMKEYFNNKKASWGREFIEIVDYYANGPTFNEIKRDGMKKKRSMPEMTKVDFFKQDILVSQMNVGGFIDRKLNPLIIKLTEMRESSSGISKEQLDLLIYNKIDPDNLKLIKKDPRSCKACFYTWKNFYAMDLSRLTSQGSIENRLRESFKTLYSTLSGLNFKLFTDGVININYKPQFKSVMFEGINITRIYDNIPLFNLFVDNLMTTILNLYDNQIEDSESNLAFIFSVAKEGEPLSWGQVGHKIPSKKEIDELIKAGRGNINATSLTFLRQAIIDLLNEINPQKPELFQGSGKTKAFVLDEETDFFLYGIKIKYYTYDKPLAFFTSNIYPHRCIKKIITECLDDNSGLCIYNGYLHIKRLMAKEKNQPKEQWLVHLNNEFSKEDSMIKEIVASGNVKDFIAYIKLREGLEIGYWDPDNDNGDCIDGITNCPYAFIVYKSHVYIALKSKVDKCIRVPLGTKVFRPYTLKHCIKKPEDEESGIRHDHWCFDIESFRSPVDGRQMPYLVCVRKIGEFSGKSYLGANCILDFVFDFIIKKVANLKRHPKKRIHVWSYNGAGYDHHLIIKVLQRVLPIKILGSSSSIKCIRISSRFEFLDLCCWYAPMRFNGLKGLAALAEMVGTAHKKTNFDHTATPASLEDPEFRKNAIEYCMNDCTVLAELVQELVLKTYCEFEKKDERLIRTDFYIRRAYYLQDKYFPYSSASLAIRIYRSCFMRDDITVRPSPPNILFYERESYHGGLTYALIPVAKDVNVYDINSSYPAVMMGVMPDTFLLSTPGKITYSLELDSNLSEIEETDLYKVDIFKFGPEVKFPNICIRTKDGGIINPRIHESPCYIWGTELILGIEMGGTFVVSCHYEYGKDGYFTSYIEYFYEKKASAKAEKKKHLELFYKMLMNSLQGKLGQKNYKKYQAGTPGDIYTAMCKQGKEPETIRFLGGGMFKAEWDAPDEMNSIGSLVRFPAYISARGRTNLIRAILAAGVENVQYMDTDSIFLINGTKLPDKFVSETELGKFKLEKTKQYCITFGAKNYVMFNGDEDTSPILKCKGVNNVPDWKEYRDILSKGDTYTAKIDSFFTRKYGSVFVSPQIRRIRKTLQLKRKIVGNTTLPFKDIHEYEEVRKANKIKAPTKKTMDRDHPEKALYNILKGYSEESELYAFKHIAQIRNGEVLVERIRQLLILDKDHKIPADLYENLLDKQAIDTLKFDDYQKIAISLKSNREIVNEIKKLINLV